MKMKSFILKYASKIMFYDVNIACYQRYTRRRPRPSTTDISDDDHSRSATRSGSTIPASNSSLESCAPDGMVPIWFWNCSMVEQYSSPIIKSVDNSR